MHALLLDAVECRGGSVLSRYRASGGVQCEAEIVRLEGIRAAATRRRTAERLADLRAACEATRLAVPPLPEDAEAVIAAQGPDVDGKVLSQPAGCCTADAYRSEQEFATAQVNDSCFVQSDGGSTPQRGGRMWARCICHNGNHMCRCAQAAALLATAEGLLREAEDAAARREEVLDRLQELELRREESAWLAAYEADDGRYKVHTCGEHASKSWPPAYLYS